MYNALADSSYKTQLLNKFVQVEIPVPMTG